MVEQTPSVGDGEEPTAEPTPEPTPEPVLDEAAFASVTTLAAGEIAEDPSGILLSVHGLVTSPPAVAPALGIDISMCGASLGADAGESFEIQLAASPTAPLGEPRRLIGPLVSPPFTFPDIGECSRGWAVVDDATDDRGTARIIVGIAADGSTERHLYQWNVEAVPSNDRDLSGGFGAGETVTFNSGPLDGSTVRMLGWAELFERPQPEAGKRLVAVSVEVCPASDVWPHFRLGIDGWIGVAPIDTDERFGWTPDSAPGQCVEGWAEFAVAFGAVPTGFVVQDFDGVTAVSPQRLVEGFAHWTLEGAALAAPE